MEETSLLENLNPPQRRAVLYSGGPLLIIAGAGSGKTRVLTHRIAHLVEGLGVSPRNIIAITFTNRAAGEMKERVRVLVGPQVEGMMVGTFHSSCARILRSEISALGYSRQFTIYDEIDSLRLVESCMEQLEIDRREWNPRSIRYAISAAKNDMVDYVSFEEDARHRGDPFSMVVAMTYQRYQENIQLNNACDFDDLLLLPVNLFEMYPEVLEKYQDRFRHVLVDEYQDTNMVQYRLVKMLAGKHRNLTVVGDDDQGIYSWRGATIRNILEFEQDFPDCSVIKLEQNYRCSSNILSAAGEVIKRNDSRKPKGLWTGNPTGEPVHCVTAASEHQEAVYVSDESARAVREEGLNYSDIAVFYRTHAQSRVIEERLIRDAIPYRIFGGTRFYERREIKDTLAYLKVMCNPGDSVSLLRIINVPARKIGATTVSRLNRHSRDHGIPLFDVLGDPAQVNDLSAAACARVSAFSKMMESLRQLKEQGEQLPVLLKEVWGRTGYLSLLEAEGTAEAESRIENLEELLNVAEDFRSQYGAVTVEEFLERASLVNDTDELSRSGGYLSLMTLHNAKGLEFPVVFMVGMEEGLFPHIRSMESASEMEEERRLCYVGMTRAMKKLCLLRAEKRHFRGAPISNRPSTFLEDLPPGQIRKARIGRQEEAGVEYAGILPGTGRPAAARVHPARPVGAPEQEAAPAPGNGAPAGAGAPPEVRAGESLVHRKWGEGRVLKTWEGNDGMEAEMEFDSVGKKQLILKYAPLSRPGS